MKNVIDCLEERGFIDALTSEDLKKAVDKPINVYVGFDPTADSLHLGNLIGIVALGWFQRFGHTPVVLLGGATGRIGDPSGKSHERPMLSTTMIQNNVAAISKHFEQVLDFSVPNAPLIVNNDEWFSQFSVIDFLRDVGKHFRLGPMLAKELVRKRIESEEGMSFTEFSYLLIQSYDFYHLLHERGVTLQMGGSDQWSNIIGGIDLIRKMLSKTAYGLTWPLLTRADGKKFGKSEEGAIWLCPEKCSPYQFYQYLVQVSDEDVITLLKRLTYLELAKINAIEKAMKQPEYVPNTAQKRLAAEVTRLIHGEEGLETALKVTAGVAPGKKAVLDVAVLKEIAGDMPHVVLVKHEVVGGKVIDLMALSGIVSSKGEANRLIKNGGAYLNNEKMTDPLLIIEERHLIGGEHLLLGAGKKKKVLVLLK